MLEQLCAEIKNYFTYEEDKHVGNFSITNNVITPSISFKTDYIRIVGSRKNDGIHQVSALLLQDEDFHGAIWEMSIPHDFLDLANEIKNWQNKYGGFDSVAMSPYNSETFGGYAYSKGLSSGNGSNATTWQSTFANRLNQYRRIRV